jgi:hypothetical protein
MSGEVATAVANPDNFSTAFTVWAAVVGIIGALVVYELARMRSELKLMGAQLNTYIVGMERRITSIETHLSIRDQFRPNRSFETEHGSVP